MDDSCAGLMSHETEQGTGLCGVEETKDDCVRYWGSRGGMRSYQLLVVEVRENRVREYEAERSRCVSETEGECCSIKPWPAESNLGGEGGGERSWVMRMVMKKGSSMVQSLIDFDEHVTMTALTRPVPQTSDRTHDAVYLWAQTCTPNSKGLLGCILAKGPRLKSSTCDGFTH